MDTPFPKARFCSVAQTGACSGVAVEKAVVAAEAVGRRRFFTAVFGSRIKGTLQSEKPKCNKVLHIA